MNGRTFDPDALSRAIAEAGNGEQIRLLIQTGKHQREVNIACPEGHCYPRLEPVPGARPRLDEILSPLSKTGN